MKNLVIYDLDGTLIDSAMTVTDILNRMLLEKSKPLLPVEIVRPLTALGGRELIEQSLACEISEVDELLDEFRSYYAEAVIDPKTLFPEVAEVLNSLKTLGYRLAICTNKPRLLAEKTIKAVGLKGFFDFMLCGGEAESNKPSPDPLIRILQHFKTKPDEALFVGDSEVDFLAAKGASVPFVFYDSGYDQRMYNYDVFHAIKHHRDIKDLIYPM